MTTRFLLKSSAIAVAALAAPAAPSAASSSKTVGLRMAALENEVTSLSAQVKLLGQDLSSDIGQEMQCIPTERHSTSATSDTFNNPNGAIDGVIDNNSWQANGAEFGFAAEPTCSDVHFVTLDLGVAERQTSVTFYNYFADTRQYCNQSIELSLTGDFSGEETRVFSCGDFAECGSSTAEGQTATFEPIVARYVRVGSSQNTLNTGVHILEVEVAGCADEESSGSSNQEATPAPEGIEDRIIEDLVRLSKERGPSDTVPDCNLFLHYIGLC